MIKKMMTGAMAVVMMAAMLFISGCDDTPSPERMNAIATAVGRTAGYACELSKTKTAVKESIALVLDVASKVVPTTDKTFAEAWTPVIAEELQKLIAAGKLDENGANFAKLALTTACDGIDYIFIKHPKAKEVQELVSVATAGFITGYKSVVSLAAGVEKPEIDEDAYKYLKSRMMAK